jgi:uncharacterized protein YbjT (DUF2867 family)
VHVAWRTGPVAVTGASGQVGRLLVQRLGQLPNQARPLGHQDDLAAAFSDADAVVHLAGTLQPRKPNTYRAANLETVLATATALARSPAQRVVYLSFMTARLDASNWYAAVGAVVSLIAKTMRAKRGLLEREARATQGRRR